MISFEMIVLVVVYGLLGATLGSFTNVIIDRLPEHTFLDQARSYCASCKKTLKWYDLIPLFSYINLRGKCRYCRHVIPPRIFFVELLSFAMFGVFAILFFSNLLVAMIAGMIFLALLAIFFIDLNHRIIPDVLLVMLMVLITIMHVVGKVSIGEYIISGIVGSLLFLILFLVTKGRGMGFGDVKFAGVIGYMMGFPEAFVALYSAFLTGALISVILVIIGKKKFKGGSIAFGPFMIAGIVIALLFTNEILALFS